MIISLFIISVAASWLSLKYAVPLAGTIGVEGDELPTTDHH